MADLASSAWGIPAPIRLSIKKLTTFLNSKVTAKPAPTPDARRKLIT